MSERDMAELNAYLIEYAHNHPHMCVIGNSARLARPYARVAVKRWMAEMVRASARENEWKLADERRIDQ